ncbi:MAG: PaaI family thioesterase [Pseudomonadota bacterium]
MPTGLELMHMMERGELPPPSIGTLFNMGMTLADFGRVMFTGVANSSHLNPAGGVHGGFAATLLDSACGCAVLSTLPEGQGYTTIDLAIKMLRPVPQSETLYCEGKIQRPGRTVAFAEAWLRNKDDKLLAHATSSCAVFPLG